MWVHWPKCLKISFLSKRYLISFVISYRLFVVFNNANAVSAEMWVWGFGNHAWNKSLLSSHSSATRDLTRLLYHLWFPKPHTHISYSQHLHITVQEFSLTSKIIFWWFKSVENEQDFEFLAGMLLLRKVNGSSSFYKGPRTCKVWKSADPSGPWTCKLYLSLDLCKNYYFL